jgi:hypothetical protein
LNSSYHTWTSQLSAALYDRFGCESVITMRVAGGRNARIALWIYFDFVNFFYQELDFLIQKGLIELRSAVRVSAIRKGTDARYKVKAYLFSIVRRLDCPDNQWLHGGG